VNRAAGILLILLLASCAPDATTVESNVRMPGEPTTVARPLTESEQSSAVDAMRAAQPPGFEAQPLERAGASGRWSDVRRAVIDAAKSCEVAMVSEDRWTDASGAVIGTTFALRSIRDVTGTMQVRGSESTGVTGVQVSMGLFGEREELARDLLRAFDRELAQAARIRRPR